MQIVHQTFFNTPPKVSFILLDWSCRESFHMLDYLNNQTIPRDDYEIIWIEYFSKRVKELDEILEKNESTNIHPPIDTWVIMGIQDGVYYHKHLMYNVGITMAKGKIIVICDSDTMVKPTFTQNILETLSKNRNSLLHLDEFRNIDKSFYPFNFPKFKDVLGPGCVNLKDGKTTGLWETVNPIHHRNYGACMAAYREDLIGIGGSDEHIDYLGHICGPYDMTFRLVNYGKEETWHQKEFLYHTWHPGTDGAGNYLGPHDGRNVSTTAQEPIRSGRIKPYVENQAIKMLRKENFEIIYSLPKDSLLPSRQIPEWDVQRMDATVVRYKYDVDLESSSFYQQLPPLSKLNKQIKIGIIFLSIIFMQSVKKVIKKSLELLNMSIFKFGNLFIKNQSVALSNESSLSTAHPKIHRGFWGTIFIGPIFISRVFKNTTYIVQACKQIKTKLLKEGAVNIAILGTGSVVNILKIILDEQPFNIAYVLPFSRRAELNDFKGKIIIATFTSVSEQFAELERLGILKENIVRLQ